jgi:hypothetical protein
MDGAYIFNDVAEYVGLFKSADWNFVSLFY